MEFQAQNLDYLRAALEALGYVIIQSAADRLQFQDASGNYARWQDGEFVGNSAFDVDEIKRAYSMAVISAVAKRRNWQVRKKTATKGTVARRY